MLRSDYCNLNGKSERDLCDLGECPYDQGGYFIINGSEKVLIAQVRGLHSQHAVCGGCSEPRHRDPCREVFAGQRTARRLEGGVEHVCTAACGHPPAHTLHRCCAAQERMANNHVYVFRKSQPSKYAYVAECRWVPSPSMATRVANSAIARSNRPCRWHPSRSALLPTQIRGGGQHAHCQHDAGEDAVEGGTEGRGAVHPGLNPLHPRGHPHPHHLSRPRLCGEQARRSAGVRAALLLQAQSPRACCVLPGLLLDFVGPAPCRPTRTSWSTLCTTLATLR